MILPQVLREMKREWYDKLKMSIKFIYQSAHHIHNFLFSIIVLTLAIKYKLMEKIYKIFFLLNQQHCAFVW